MFVKVVKLRGTIPQDYVTLNTLRGTHEYYILSPAAAASHNVNDVESALSRICRRRPAGWSRCERPQVWLRLAPSLSPLRRQPFPGPLSSCPPALPGGPPEQGAIVYCRGSENTD